MNQTITEGTVKTNGIEMHYARAGEGPAVVFLHGFPEFWYSWRYQLDALSEAGFTAVAPDLRGYGLTDKPSSGYDMPNLVSDVAGLTEALGFESYTVVGHDWGGPLAWTAAMLLPQVERLAVFNGPHPGIYLNNLFTSRQFFMSWYIYLIQIPGIAESKIRADNYEVVRKMFRDAQKRGSDTLSDEDIERFVTEISKPGALECGLRYYRALFKSNPLKTFKTIRKVKVPTCVTWGMDDFALIPDTTNKLEKWIDAPFELHYIENAGHWVTQEQPDRCNRILIDFLRSY